MKPKPITENFSYRFRVARENILHALLSFCILFLFIMALYYGSLSPIGILKLSVLVIVVLLIKLVRKLLLFLSVKYIESLIVERKLDIGFKVCKVYLKYNPLLYFINSQGDLDFKIKRFLNSNVDHEGSIRVYNLLLFIFYYPLMRLLYCYLLVIRAVFSDNVTQPITKRVEFYVVILICSLPFIFDNYNWRDFLYFYLFLLFLLFPILNLIGHYLSLVNYYLFKPSSNSSYINKLIAFIIKYGISFSLPSFSFTMAYPTIFTLNLMRNDISLFSKLSNLYCNIAWPSLHTCNEDFIFMKLFLHCGTDSKRACIWKYYYVNNVANFTAYYELHIFENNKYISYSGYKALYNVLSENGYDAWLIEFFIDLHKYYNSEPIEAELLKQLNQSIDNHLVLMEKLFKLIWDIEADGAINPIDVIPGIKDQLPFNLDYPVNQYCVLLFGGFNRLDGLFITPDVYKQNISHASLSSKLNGVLESKIIDFFIDNHKNIESRLSPKGHGGIFQENGLHLITNITMPELTDIYNALVIRTCSDPDNIMNFKHNASMMAYDSLFFDDEVRIREFVIERLGESLAKGREEGKNDKLTKNIE